MGQFLLIALGTFASEDLTCITTGALIAAGKLGFVPGVLACIVGIYAGDLLLYFAGRFVGRPILRWRPLRKLLTVEKLDRASEWLADRGAGVVILSRFTPGLRLPTYVAAGLLKTRFWTFALYFLAAAVIWTPALVGAAALLGRSLPRVLFLGPALLIIIGVKITRLTDVARTLVSAASRLVSTLFAHPRISVLTGRSAGTSLDAAAPKTAPGAGPGARGKSVETSLDVADTSVRATSEVLGAPLRQLSFAWQSRRRAVGWLGRKTRWEFWPPWLAYLPVAPYIIYLASKHRSLALFTAANPGIPSGGFAGESKSAILEHLPHVPDFLLLPANLTADARSGAVREFLISRGLSYPVVLKPDVGERGRGVAIARNDQDVRSYFLAAPGDTIVQKYVGGLEFGVSYYRYPGEPHGRISSITAKRFPTVVGDGVSTISELILRDERAVCLADVYLGRFQRTADSVPAAGEAVPLAELGSHCRGAIFLNAADLETEALRVAVDATAQSHSGFFLGRFDVRSASLQDFEAGRFQVLELNGVTAEPTHIYDPSVSLLEAYRALFRQWRIAFEIGAMNRQTGEQPMGLRELMELVRNRRSSSPCPGPKAATLPVEC